MKGLIKIAIVLLVVVGGGAAAYSPLSNYLKERNKPEWNTEAVERGKIVSVVNATGTVKPVLSVSVGSFVSGPIIELKVDFNDEVKKDQVLAVIDPRLYQANVAREEATLKTRNAEVERVMAELQQAKNNERRGRQLREEDEGFISDQEMDALTFRTQSLEAQLKLAKAAVDQAQASLDNSNANLGYTKIVSPVDGVVIDRKIDPGQTLAAQFQTPELFIVAPDLRKKVHVFASVDEADIGFIQQAKKENRPVEFNVDAHREELFHGVIEQIRVSSETTQNVVTYPVVVAATNPDLKLLPGMTASISFQVDAKEDVLKVPNSALRFYPNPKHVREEDKEILEGVERTKSSSGEEKPESMLSAAEKAAANRQRNRRHVWVVDGDKLRAVEVVTGLIENKYSEIVEGDLQAGDELVTGLKKKK